MIKDRSMILKMHLTTWKAWRNRPMNGIDHIVMFASEDKFPSHHPTVMASDMCSGWNCNEVHKKMEINGPDKFDPNEQLFVGECGLQSSTH
jgi:hypothetical protein